MSTTDPQLYRLDVLRQFKKKMPSKELGENVSPFDDRVTTAQGTVQDFDLAGIHADVRSRIENILASVREGTKKSQVILMAGDAGMGKTHLLRTFQSPKLAKDIGYVYVGGSNHWKISEFQARLLDWMIEALTAPSPNQDHLLLNRVRVIGFRALEQLLSSPVAWQQCLAQPERGLIARLLGRLKAPSQDQLLGMVAKRDPKVFDLFDFGQFSAYVCDRFLIDRSNIIHRYALRVLLTYLFSEPHEHGVGVRERVLHWFRGRSEGDYFHHRLGAAEKLDRHYGLFEAVKLLVHLFSPSVSKELSTEENPCPSKVFLFVFDQAEGRNELFDKKEDWMDFFAHLCELYNTLPNVVVLFSSTLNLRNEMHSVMERQFKDRILMDTRFQLKLPTPPQIQDLYRKRIECWLQDDTQLLERYQNLDNPAEPFTPEKLQEIAGRESIRDVLKAFDASFHQAMAEQVWAEDPAFDFLYQMNELRKQEEATNEHNYSANHLATVRELLDSLTPWLFDGYRILVKTEDVRENDINALKIKMNDTTATPVWLCAYLVRVSHANIQAQVDAASAILTQKLAHRSKYTLWLVRHNRISQWSPTYPDQTFHDVIPPKVESTLRALLHVIAKQSAYEKEGHWKDAQRFIRGEFENTYLHELLKDGRQRLDQMIARQIGAEDATEASTAMDVSNHTHEPLP